MKQSHNLKEKILAAKYRQYGIFASSDSNFLPIPVPPKLVQKLLNQ